MQETERRAGPFDVVGAVSSTLGMTALVYGMVRSASDGWGDAGTMAALGAGVLLLVGFVLNEWRAGQPIMPLRLFAAAAGGGRSEGCPTDPSVPFRG